ncbi:K02A2.6-like, partial [Cordylochernes scorpioides]
MAAWARYAKKGDNLFPMRRKNSHLAPACPHKTKPCFKFKRIGHLSRVCKTGKSLPDCRYVQDEFIYSVQGDTDAKINLHVDEYQLCFVVDTGSPVTLIPKTIYEKYWKDNKLSPSFSRLRSFCGKPIKIIGERRVFVKEANQDLRLIVVDEDISIVLLGREWLKGLNLDFSRLLNIRQVRLSEEAKRVVNINTTKGLFAFKRLPYGVAVAPNKFQREMDNLFADMSGVACYIDDILVAGKDHRNDEQKLELVFKRLEEKGLRLNKDKCKFAVNAVEYLGFKIDKKGLPPISSKIEAVVEAPEPTNVSQLRSFIGLLMYYSRFIRNIADILAPFYHLLKKNSKWNWTSEHRILFAKCKALLTNESVLAHYDATRELVLACDASSYGLGVVLSHRNDRKEETPIAFASRTLTEAERRYSQLEKEALSIIFGCEKFRQYLLGREFVLITDNRPLMHIFSPQKPIPICAASRIKRWSLKLSAFKYTVEFLKTDDNGHADALSRLPLVSKTTESLDEDQVLLLRKMSEVPFSFQEVAVETRRDKLLSIVLRNVRENNWQIPKVSQENPLYSYYRIKDELSCEFGCLQWRERVVIPQKIRSLILNDLHEMHLGMVKMKMIARRYFWWPGIDKNIEELARDCRICQESASKEAYNIFEHLDLSDEQRNNSDEIINALTQHFTPKINIIYERSICNQTNQETNESIEQYICRLRKLSSTCNYGAMTEEMIRDRLVLGIIDKQTKRQLISDPQLTLQKAIDVCKANESANKQIENLTKNTQEEVNKLNIRKKTVNQNKMKKNIPCRYCATFHEHNRQKCPAWNQTCRKCNKKNHWAKVCKSRMRTVQSLESQNSNDEQEDCYSLEYVSEISARKLMTKLELELNGYKESIICQIDTGATVNVLNFADLCKIMQDGNPSLKPSYIKLRCYGGEILKPKGQIKINCFHQSKQHPIVFQVIDHWEKPILSAETCQKLNLIEIKADLCEIESTWTKQNNLLDKYKDIFEGIGCLQGEYKLETDPTIKPIKQAPRRVPITLRKELKEKLRDMEKKNNIVKVDYPTDWISNLVLVKSTKKLRICIDPRELNVALKRAEYPIPRIEEIIPNLQNAKIFTVVDTKDGFWNVNLSDESSNLTTFWTPFGRYKFLRMPFGLKTASEEYQRRLYEIFQGLEGIEIIADDILILGKGDSYEEALKDHDRNLENLFKTARQANLKFNINKVKLRLKEVKYLGHIITPHGLKPDPEKVKALKEMPHPETIQCDASKHGLGATLLQESQPIIFASRSLSKTEQNYAQIEKECIAIVFACERFHQYILGKCQVIVQTDHKPLLSIFKKSILKAPQRLQRMLLRLQRYNLELEHVQGSQMHLADIFSRACIKDVRNENLKYDVYPIDIIYKEIATVNVMETLSVCSDTVLRIREETSSDPILCEVKKLILNGWPPNKNQTSMLTREYWNFREELTVQDGIILKNDRIVIPNKLRAEMIMKTHQGHIGINSSMRRARDNIFWPGMNAQIGQEIENCSICLSNSQNQVREPMKSHKIPNYPWERISLDIFEIFKQNYLIIVDHYSDFFEVECLENTTSEYIIECCKRQFSRYGIPQIIVSDNGRQFTSTEFQKFGKEWQFQHSTSSPLHSQGNGKAEAAVKIAKNLLKKSKLENSDFFWQNLLNWRNTPTIDIDSSPVQRIMSRRTRAILPIHPNLLKPSIPENIPDKISIKRQQAKYYYDRKSKNLPDLDIGQEVYVRTPNTTPSWSKANITNEHNTRSYDVNIHGRTYRRNRTWIKPQQASANQKSTNNQEEGRKESIDQEQTVSNCLPSTSSAGGDNIVKRTRMETTECRIQSKSDSPTNLAGTVNDFMELDEIMDAQMPNKTCQTTQTSPAPTCKDSSAQTELIKPATPAPAAVLVAAPALKKPDPALTKRKHPEASNPPAKRTKSLVPAKPASSRTPKPAVAKGTLNGEKSAAHIVVIADNPQADPRDILKAVRAAHTLPQGVWASLRTRGKLVMHSNTPEAIPAVSSALDNKLQGLKVQELMQFLPRICLFNVE